MRLLGIIFSACIIGLGLVTFKTSSVAAGTIRVPVLTYHYIGVNPNPKDTLRNSLSVTPDNLEQQLTYLKNNGYNPITINQLFGALQGKESLPPKPIVLTFDDGYIDFYTTAYPILQKYQFHAVAFIATGLIGKGYYMNWDQIMALNNSGLIDIEAHTVNHLDLTRVTDSKLKYELAESKRKLEEVTGHPINFIAYPYGLYNSHVIAAAQRAGFIGGFSTRTGMVTNGSFSMPRIDISGKLRINEFIRKLS